VEADGCGSAFRVLVGHMSARDRSADARLEFGHQRVPVMQAGRIAMGFGRLSEHSEGEAARPNGARRKHNDRGGERG
jgi:hypothetical protein